MSDSKYKFKSKEEIYKILSELKEGDTFVNQHGYKCHVVVNLPKEDGGHVVFKWYGKHKQWWHYCVESYYYFELRMREEEEEEEEEDFKKLNIKIKK